MNKVLLIEDDLDVRENVSEILEISGYDVTTAENGLIGLKKANEVVPDIIICDVMMPEMDGFSVLYSMSKNEKLAGIPFIFLTAKAEKDDIRKGMRLGADDYLTKPFETTELLQAIETRLKKNKNLQENYQKSVAGLNDLVNDSQISGNWKEILNESNATNYKKKDVIYREGSSPQSVYYLVEGSVKQTQLHKDGKELIDEIYTESRFFGYNAVMANQSHRHSAICIEDSKIIAIPVKDFENLLATNNDFKIHLMRILSGDLKSREAELIEVTYGTVRSRVADGLKRLAEKYGDNAIPLTREELAQFIGIATETLIRTLTEFKKEGFVSMDGKKIIANTEALDKFRF